MDEFLKRWRRVLAVSLVAVLAIAGVLTAAFQFGLPWWMGDRDSNHTFNARDPALLAGVACLSWARESRTSSRV